MNRAERAIIMAAGLGSRMAPVTDVVPKPLVKVGGVPMIETIIEALHKNNIHEIHVVVGYRREQFRYLPKKYPGVSLIENPDYLTANNISSLYYARAYLENTIILDGDQIIRDPEILAPDFLRSGYCAIHTDEATDEWLLQVEDNVVTQCSRTGGQGGWELHSVSFWSQADGKRLREHLAQEFSTGNREIYWDDVALFCHSEDYCLGIRPISRDALWEIDSFEELKQIDPLYRGEEWRRLYEQ